MSTTTIRLPDELKARLATAAERHGVTTHGFILEALADRAEQEERREDFHATAERRWEAFLETGLAVPWSEMRQYMLDRAAGKSPAKPVARKVSLKPTR
jgi:predicted transcriptional regulator